MRTIIVTATLGAFVDAGRLDKKKAKGTFSECGVKGGSKRDLDFYHHEVKGPNMSIVNGHPATECEWRWQVGLRSTETGRPWCGGQLIHPEWVLTAAHCAGAPNFNVVAGDYNVNEPNSPNEQSRWAVQVFRHPQYYSRTIDWDFALVRLESPIELNDCVGTVCLPTQGNDIPAGSQCWITGWGTLSSGGGSPEVLQEAEVTILSQQACKDSDYSADSITDAMICAQGRKANGDIVDACQGDSGGPLVCEADGKWTVYGATSWGRGCAGATYPGVWARVHEAVSWIEETMEANSGPIPTPPSCPDFARNPFPDSDGDCQCPWGQYCSTNGSDRNCPTSGAIGGYGGTYFLPSCDTCGCVNY